jgi:hypothetical protein
MFNLSTKKTKNNTNEGQNDSNSANLSLHIFAAPFTN